MRVLLDTQVLVRLASGTGKLKPALLAVLERPEVELLASVISIWEIRVKWRARHPSGDRKLDLSPTDAMLWTAMNGIPVQALDGRDCTVEVVPEVENDDPFDDMMIVHAHLLGARLLTVDRKLRAHPLALAP